MRIPKNLRKLTPEEIGNRSELDAPLKKLIFSIKVTKLFPYMFGSDWEKFMTVKGMVRKLVYVDRQTKKQVLRLRGLMFIDEDYCCARATNDRRTFYEAWPKALPEILTLLKKLQFLS
jgi:hypothetical protein